MTTAFSRALVFKETQSGDAYVLDGYNPSTMSLKDLEISLKIMIVPDSYKGKPVVAIAKNAFRYCEYLYKVFLPKSIKIISDGAFSGCSNLEEFFWDGDKKTEAIIGSCVFLDCSNLERVEIRHSLMTGSHVFQGCEKLSIFECYYVDKIPEYWFRGCSSLTEVEFVACKELNKDSFSGTNISQITFNTAIPALTEGTVSEWISEGITIICNKYNPLANLAYDGLNVEIF